MEGPGFVLRLERAPEDAHDESRARAGAAVLAALRDHAGLDEPAVLERDGSRSALELTPSGLLALARSQPPPTDPAGEPRPEHAVRLTFVAGGELDARGTLVSLTLGDRQLGDHVRAELSAGLGPERSAGAFESCVRAFSPRFGCLECPQVKELREQEGEAVGLADEMLHWRTYFGPGGREHAVDLDGARRLAGVLVRALHEGTEIALGERFESAGALRELQRLAEPVVLGARRRGYPSTLDEAEGSTLGITMPPGDPELMRAHADSLASAGEALDELARKLEDPAAVATDEWLRLSMRLAVAERELTKAAAAGEQAFGPKVARAFAGLVERMLPSIVQARQTAEQCLQVARRGEA